MFRPIAALLTLAGLAVATEADAQFVTGRGYAMPAAPYATPAASPAPYGSMTYSRSDAGPGAMAPPTRTYSYSYYTLSPLPARTYVGYGANDFPFHGVAYGRPYDPWTWPMMSGYYANGLARYYDPPVK